MFYKHFGNIILFSQRITRVLNVLRQTMTATNLFIYQNGVQKVDKLRRKLRYKNVIFVA